MKSQASNSAYPSPYAKHHPLWKRQLTFLLLASFMIGTILIFWPFDHLGKEYNVGKPNLRHNSEPRTTELNLKGVSVTSEVPVDNRFEGFDDSFLMQEIRNKIDTDMNHFSASATPTEKKNLVIKTKVNEFSSSGKGFFWKQSIGKVNLDITALLNDSVIVSKNYHIRYATGGLDKNFEGSLIAINENEPSIVAMGVSLRMTLDYFYKDLAKVITKATKLNNVLFRMGTTDFESGAESNLLAVVDAMKHNPKMKIQIEGYADNQGDILKDKNLSMDRALTVKSYLIDHGIKARRIKTKAFGVTKPVSTNHSEESRRLNRRVEFVIIKA